MAGPSDIEEAEETKSDVTSSTFNASKPFSLLGDSISELSPSATKKSMQASITMSVDRSLLSMVENDEDPEDEVRRKSQLCCGSCCDFVRACLVVDVIYISVLAFINVSNWFFPQLLGPTMGTRIRINPSEEEGDVPVYDDMVDDMVDDMFDETSEETSCYFCTTAIQNVLGMFLALIGAIGAWRFQKYMVLVAAIWFCIDAVLFCIFDNWASGLWVLVYAYPHFGLFLALRSGKITRENYYVTEQHCCGCDSDRNNDDDDNND